MKMGEYQGTITAAEVSELQIRTSRKYWVDECPEGDLNPHAR